MFLQKIRISDIGTILLLTAGGLLGGLIIYSWRGTSHAPMIGAILGLLQGLYRVGRKK